MDNTYLYEMNEHERQKNENEWTCMNMDENEWTCMNMNEIERNE